MEGEEQEPGGTLRNKVDSEVRWQGAGSGQAEQEVLLDEQLSCKKKVLREMDRKTAGAR